MNLYNIELKKINGEMTTMSPFKGQVILVVNTACLWGFTPQFGGLEKLWTKYKDQGFVILGFPCNQFGSQDPWDEPKINEFVKSKYGVTFPMFSKIEVNGSNTHPLFQYIKEFGDGQFNQDLRWNFTKFLLDRNGHVVKRFEGKDEPADMDSDIVKLLDRKASS